MLAMDPFYYVAIEVAGGRGSNHVDTEVAGGQRGSNHVDMGVAGGQRGSNHVDTGVAGGQVPPESSGPSTRCTMN